MFKRWLGTWDGNYISLNGLIRFKEVGPNFLYAEFEPDNNVIEGLSKHFKARLKNQNWIIHDKKRKIVSIYNTTDYMITDEGDFNFSLLENVDDKLYEELWKTFYNSLAIK